VRCLWPTVGEGLTVQYTLLKLLYCQPLIARSRNNNKKTNPSIGAFSVERVKANRVVAYSMHSIQRCICIMDPLKGPSLQISSCSSLHRPIGATNTSSYFMRNVGGKRESLSFYCPVRPLYIENVALRAMYSLSMLEHVQSTHEHSMYSMISMTLSYKRNWVSY
jgi:hypothetical protein